MDPDLDTFDEFEFDLSDLSCSEEHDDEEDNAYDSSTEYDEN